MTTSPLNRQSAWMLGAAVLAAGAVTIALMAGSTGTSAAVERSLEPEVPAPIEPERAELTAPTTAGAPVRMAASGSTLPASEATATEADRIESSVVDGVLLLPRGFPGPERWSLGAWALGEGASTAPIAGAPVEGAPGANSSFRFENVPEGPWTFVARAETEGRIAWGRSEPITAVPGAHIEGVRVRLEEYVVEGIVTDRAGVPLAGIPVGYGWETADEFAGRRLEPPAEEHPQTHTDVADIASADPLPDPPSTLPPAAEADAETGAEVAPVELEAMLRALESAMQSPAAGLQGIGYGGGSEPPAPGGFRIVGAGNGDGSFTLSKGTFELGAGSFSSGNIVITMSPGNGSFRSGRTRSQTVFTDASGSFRIALEGPGTVGLTAPGVPEEGEKEWIPKDESVTVSTEASEARADFELMRAAHIEGRVIRSDSEPGNISVFLRPARGGRTQTEATNKDGMFRFDELAPGQYLFYARSGGRRGQDFSLHLEVDLTEGGTAIIDDMLTPSSSVFGLVTNAAGEPLAGVQVNANGVINGDLTRTATTDDTGQFEIVGMYACDYVLSVSGHKLIVDHRVTVPARGARVDAGLLEVKVAR